METLLVFLTLLATVSAKNLPSENYVPTKEQLEMIFGTDTHNPEKTTTIETPALVLDKSDTIEEKIKLCHKINEIFNIATTESVEVNIKIKVNDCGEKGAPQNATQNPVDSDPEHHTRFVENEALTDDRVSIDGKHCPSNKVRVGNDCVTPDR